MCVGRCTFYKNVHKMCLQFLFIQTHVIRCCWMNDYLGNIILYWLGNLVDQMFILLCTDEGVPSQHTNPPNFLVEIEIIVNVLWTLTSGMDESSCLWSFNPWSYPWLDVCFISGLTTGCITTGYSMKKDHIIFVSGIFSLMHQLPFSSYCPLSLCVCH